MATFELPHDFLLGPGRPKVLKAVVDFTRTDLPEYRGRYAAILDDVFTKDECDTIVRAAEAQSNGVWEQAMINVGGGRQALMTDSRDCGRIIWDDPDIVDRIWARIKGSVPEIEFLKDMSSVTGYGPVKRGETWKMTRLNERMRFLKYGQGQYFRRKYHPCTPPSAQTLTHSSAQRWLLCDSRRQRGLILHPSSILKRGEPLQQPHRRSNDVSLIQHATRIRCRPKSWQGAHLPTPGPVTLRRRC